MSCAPAWKMVVSNMISIVNVNCTKPAITKLNFYEIKNIIGLLHYHKSFLLC